MADKRDYYEVLGVAKNASADEIKKARRNELMALQSRISLRKNKSKIGKELLVLCEEEIAPGIYEGRSGGDSPEIDNKIIFKGKADGYILWAQVTNSLI